MNWQLVYPIWSRFMVTSQVISITEMLYKIRPSTRNIMHSYLVLSNK